MVNGVVFGEGAWLQTRADMPGGWIIRATAIGFYHENLANSSVGIINT